MSRLSYFHKEPAPCPWCGDDVIRSDQKFCSKSCLATSKNFKGIKKELPIVKVVCGICTNEFVAPNQSRARQLPPKYCSAICHHKSLIGIKRSDETREKYSIAASKRNACTIYTKGVGGTRPDIGHYVRSSWEANISRLLIYLNIPYEFEKYQFIIIDNNGRNIIYTPDFKISNRFIEVKGWWNDKSLLIKQLMHEQHPGVRISYVDERFYNRLKQIYSTRIPNWEFKTRNQRKKI